MHKTTITRLIILTALLASLLPYNHSIPAPVAAQGNRTESYRITFDELAGVANGMNYTVVYGEQVADDGSDLSGGSGTPALTAETLMPVLGRDFHCTHETNGGSCTQDPVTGEVVTTDTTKDAYGYYNHYFIAMHSPYTVAANGLRFTSAYDDPSIMWWNVYFGYYPSTTSTIYQARSQAERYTSRGDGGFWSWNLNGGAGVNQHMYLTPAFSNPIYGIQIEVTFAEPVLINTLSAAAKSSNDTEFTLYGYYNDTVVYDSTWQIENTQAAWRTDSSGSPGEELITKLIIDQTIPQSITLDDLEIAWAPEPRLCIDRTFDFQNNDDGWIAGDLTEHDGFFISSDAMQAVGYYPDLGPGLEYTNHLHAWYAYDELCTVDNIHVRWQVTRPDRNIVQPLTIRLFDSATATLTAEAELRLTSAEQWHEYTWTPLDAQSGFPQFDAVQLFYGDLADIRDPDPGVGAIAIDSITINVVTPSDVILSGPLDYADELALGQYGSPFTYDYDYALSVFSTRWGADVHAVYGGTVESVLPVPRLAPDLCMTAHSGADTGRQSGSDLREIITEVDLAVVSVNPWLFEPESSCLLSHPELPVGGNIAAREEYRTFFRELVLNQHLDTGILNKHDIYVALEGGYTVVVDSPAGKFHYFVQNPTVQPGDTVTQGCIIGQTTGFYPEDGSPQLELSEKGIALIALYGENGPIPIERENFGVCPAFYEACGTGSAPVESQCLNHNPQFQGLNGWMATNPTTTTLPEGGLKLTGITYHEHIIALDPESQYSIVVEAHLENPAPDGQPSILQIGLGDTRPPNAPLEISVPADGSTVRATVPPSTWPANYTPDQYELMLNPKLFNSGTIIVDFLCISDNEDAPVHLPTSCYFADPNFDTGGGWIPSSGNVNGDPVFSNGAVAIPHGGYVGQTVTLVPGDYTIEYTGRRHPTLFTGEPYIEVTWDFGTHSGGLPLAYTTWEQGADTFTVSETTTAQFTFTATNGINADETAIQLDRVCIVPASGPPPTGGSVGGGDTGTGCRTCNYTPSSDMAHNIVEMTSWLGCKVDAIWYCEAEPIAKSTEEGVHEIVRGMGMLGRFLSYSFTVGLKQTESVAYYLAGYIHNAALRIADGRVVMIEDQSIGFWDVLNSLITGLRDVLVTALDDIVRVLELLLAFLAPAVGTLANLIVGVANILIMVFNMLLAQVMLIPALAATVINSFVQASAMPIPGAPDCTTLNSNPLCLGIYVIDNTIFSGPAGLLIPILLASATLWLAIWTIDRFAGAFQ